MDNYSVLMLVYAAERLEHLAQAFESMMGQTVQPNDFVVVCDGPLTAELDAYLEQQRQRYPGVVQLVRLSENRGTGAAANEGLRYCRNDLVAKMDADDISVACRCEKQLQAFLARPELAVLGGDIEEFDKDPDAPFAVRSVPKTYEGIRRFARRRQPFNNVSVMYRRSAVEAVGGYRQLRRSEDFDLYVRLLHAGYPAANLDEVLVKARVNTDAVSRRASWETLKGCAHSRWNAYRLGCASLMDVAVCVGGELFIMLCPGKMQQWIYRRFLRRECSEGQKGAQP